MSACGGALGDTLPAGPDMITLTQVELEGFFNYPVRELDDIIESARKIHKEGAGRVLVEMREREHALLVTGDEALMVGMPVDDGGTTSGVWPALIAGFLAGRVQHQSLDAAMEMGAAAAGYTASQVGHEFGTMGDVEAFSKASDLTSPEKLAEKEVGQEERSDEPTNEE